jgi:arginyl-tRNA synthetase
VPPIDTLEYGQTYMTAKHDAAPAGTIDQGETMARAAIESALRDMGFEPRGPIDLRPLPFAGTWGAATSVSHAAAGAIAQRELAEEGALDGLSKKEARKLTSERAREHAQAIAEGIAERLRRQGGFAEVEAVNGYVNISFDANVVATGLIDEIRELGADYGQLPPQTERVMVEHSQPNTHKVFHVGHLRNTSLGIAVSNILAKAGYPVTQATYPGDIGMHVIKALWCYDRFHRGQEPPDPADRGRWLGQVYAESDARLEYRKDVIAFLNLLIREDAILTASIDRLLKLLWRQSANTEDIAYLMGRFSGGAEIAEGDVIDDRTIPLFWPILGEQLAAEAEADAPLQPADQTEEAPEITTTPSERLETWHELNEHIAWWPEVPRWRDEVREMFQRWEARDPAFMQLWDETREWSLADFRRIFEELGATFDVWFFESQVEEEGKEIVKELLAAGIAEVSDGAVVVKIDEKLGLEEETFRTLPILRSDGTSLYSTKDLALTKRKFEDFGIDRAIWVVDVRQSLYFKQIFKILELWGFEQAVKAYHLPYEIVVLPEGVISSRKGRAPLYDDVRDMVLGRAREIIEEKNPGLSADERERVAWQVGIGSLKYAMLVRDNNKVVVFDLDEALSFDGHAAPYIQYAHARACRILENANWTPGSSGPDPQLDFGDIHPEELGLLQILARFPEEVRRAAEQYRPLLIANYAFDLARSFNDFYHACPVIQSEEPVRTARLALVDATSITIANALALLGIESPQAM